MYTYTVPFAARSDSANCSDRLAGRHKPTDVCKHRFAEALTLLGKHRYLLTQTDTCILFPSALGQTHRQVFR